MRAALRGDGPGEGPAVAVEHRQRPQIDAARGDAEGEIIAERVQVGAAVVAHHALRVAGGARGIAERNRVPLVVGVADRIIRVAGGKESLVFGVADDLAGGGQRVVDADHQGLFALQQVERRARHRGEFAVDQEHAGFPSAQDEGDDRRVEPGVDGADHAAGHRDAVMRLQHGRDVGRKHGNGVAAADAVGGQRGGEAAAAFEQLRIGDAAVAMHHGKPVREHAGGAHQEGDRRQRHIVGRVLVEVLVVDGRGHGGLFPVFGVGPAPA